MMTAVAEPVAASVQRRKKELSDKRSEEALRPNARKASVEAMVSQETTIAFKDELCKHSLASLHNDVWPDTKQVG